MVKTNSSISSSDRSEARQFLIKALRFAPILAAILIVNLRVDPGHIYTDASYEAGIATLLSQGKNVANLTNYDERLVQKYWIERLKKAPDVVVLGSSRMMQVGSDFFPGKTLINNSVSGASLEDIVGIYQIYRDQGLHIKTIVIGLDPWVLNKNNKQGRWTSIKDKTFSALSDLKIQLSFIAPPLVPEKYTNAFSLSYFQAAFQKWRKDSTTLNSGIDYLATDAKEGSAAIRLSDGQLVYEDSRRKKSIEDVQRSAITDASAENIYSLTAFHEINSELKLLLEEFLKHLKKDNINILLVLPPYHPSAWTILSRRHDSEMILHAEQTIRDIAKSENLTALGSYDPSRAGLEPEDFFDFMHPKEVGMRRIFSSWSHGNTSPK